MKLSGFFHRLNFSRSSTFTISLGSVHGKIKRQKSRRVEWILIGSFLESHRSITTPWSGLGDSRDQNHAHVYFFFFPWLALYVALDYLIHRWPMLEKMRKTLSVAILVAMKVLVLVDNVCACEKGDLVKPRFCKRAWIFLRREMNYFNNKCSDPTILF